MTRERAHQITAAAAEAHVPGPGLSFPIPKNVAIVDAQSGAVAERVVSAGAMSALIVLTGKAGLTQIFRNVPHRRGDNVLSTRPFAEINQTTPLTAEWEIL